MITFREFIQHAILEADAAGAAPAGGAAGSSPSAGGAAPVGGDLGGLGGAGAAPAGGDIGGAGGGADLGGGLGGGLGGATASVPAPKIKVFNVWQMLKDEKDEAEGKKEPEKEV